MERVENEDRMRAHMATMAELGLCCAVAPPSRLEHIRSLAPDGMEVAPSEDPAWKVDVVYFFASWEEAFGVCPEPQRLRLGVISLDDLLGKDRAETIRRMYDEKEDE